MSWEERVKACWLNVPSFGPPPGNRQNIKRSRRAENKIIQLVFSLVLDIDGLKYYCIIKQYFNYLWSVYGQPFIYR